MTEPAAPYGLKLGNGAIRDLRQIYDKFRTNLFVDLEKFLRDTLLAHPERGDQIPGGRGARKIRCGLPSFGISKRDGLRIVYQVSDEFRAVLIVRVYYKKEIANVLPHEMSRAVRDITVVFDAEAMRRGVDPEIFRSALRRLVDSSPTE